MADLKYRLTLNDMMSRRLTGAISKTKKLDNTIGRVQNRIIGFGAAFLGGQALVGFGKSTLEALKNYEFFSASLRTLMGGDEKAAGVLQKRLIEFAKVTPFSLLEVQQGTKQLLAMGASFDQVLPEMKMLGDISAGLAVPMERLILNFGQVRVQGKLTGRELRDFSVAGVPLLETLSDTMGKTKKELIGMVSAGEIGFPEVKKAFSAMTEEGGRFFKLMEQQSLTVGGRLSNMGDSWEQLQVQIGKSQTGIINGTVDWVARGVSALEEYMSAINDLEKTFADFHAPQVGDDFSFIQKVNSYLAGRSEGVLDDVLSGGLISKRNELLFRQDFLSRQVTKAGSDVPELNQLKNIRELELKSLNIRRGKTIKEDKRIEGLLGFHKSNAERLRKKEGREGISSSDFMKERGLLKKSINDIEGAITLAMAEGKVTPQEGGEDVEGRVGSAGFGTGVEISGRRPQEINITIDSLVEQLNIEAATIEESNEELKEKVSQILIEVVNDANTTSR